VQTISAVLRRIDGRGYKAYKDLTGVSERVGDVVVRVVRVQGDPFAPPSIVEAVIPVEPGGWERAPVAAADYVLRRLAREAGRLSLRGVGEGKSGLLRLPTPGPIMVPRAAVRLEPGSRPRLRILVWAGLPSRRRRVLGGAARELLLERVPMLARAGARALGDPQVSRWVETWLDQEYIRGRLPGLGLAAFVADGSILPRRCGGCWEPLEGAVPFESPASLRVEMDLPSGRRITGMGVPEGLTLIAGPAFYGKTTLLEALAAGVWNHVPGDGREYVVTRRDAFWVQSENGRWVNCVDIHPWVERLPGDPDTRCWSTSDASGATSAIASLQEAVEAGSRLLIIDEDWTATNFIHRDPWTEEVTGKKTLLTITDLAPSLRKAGISLIIVASGTPQLLAAADTVIVMDEYRPIDATETARKHATPTRQEYPYEPPAPRMLARPLHLEKPRLRGTLLESRSLPQPIDLSSNRQLEDPHQLETAVRMAARVLARPGLLAETARQASARLWEDPAGALPPSPGTVWVRHLDVLHVVNRIPNKGVVPAPRGR